MTEPDALARARALLGEARLARSALLKCRFERRAERLERIVRETALKRQQALADPLARALARAQALAEKGDDA
ncbi:MAG: hypothetical protein ACOVKN_06580 [Arenimonas sp.]|jgi:hypothetical protein